MLGSIDRQLDKQNQNYNYNANLHKSLNSSDMYNKLFISAALTKVSEWVEFNVSLDTQ